MSLVFASAKKRAAREPISFTLDDREYQFNPPKTAGLVLAATTSEQLRAQLNWLEGGLGEEDAAHIRARLFDTDDELDAVDLVQIVNGLLEEMSGRPTGPSPDS